MALVELKGQFLQAALKEKTYEGTKSINVQLDLYQPDSPALEKTIQIKVDDVSLLKKFQDSFKMGSQIKISAVANAYKNKTYYKFIELIPLN